VGGIEKCPADGRVGKRSKCFVLKGASRSRLSEDRQHPWWEYGGKTITLSEQSCTRQETALFLFSTNTTVDIHEKDAFLVEKKGNQKSMQSAEWRGTRNIEQSTGNGMI
jgi:hypothetical protein